MNDNSPRSMQRVWGRLLNKRMIPRYLFSLACLATLTGLFYAEENWRGKRAWEKCRHELEAKGAVLDWNAYIPPPVPDEQNIFKAPKMTEWFTKRSLATAFSIGSTNAGKAPMPFSLSPGWNTRKNSALLAVVDVRLPGRTLPPEKADAVWHYEDPASREQVAKLLDDLTGPRLDSAQGGVIFARQWDTNKPLHLALLADTQPTVAGLNAFLTSAPESRNQGTAPDHSYFQVLPRGSNVFQVALLHDSFVAADYLAASEPAVPNLDLVRQAVERRYARMDGDYQRPFERPVADWVRLRTVAILSAQRSMCYQLLGQPEAAWRELALVRNTCRMLEARPESDCSMLVGAMIDVAINGLYTQIVHGGLRLHAWREPELVAMQKQLIDINLLPIVRMSFNAERAASCRTLEITPPAELAKLFAFGNEQRDLWSRLKDPKFLLLRFAPRGWLYQNMCAGAIQVRHFVGSLDVTNNQILPHVADSTRKETQTALSHFAPYTFLFASALPNFLKASQTMARNQTLVNEAFVACGLERYRLAHGQYPETLDALLPQFAEKLPHDIIGGQPLKYHRTADGRFVLYSVGWNGKDDGGVVGKAVEEGDWVWE
jgi:hypothetical protein